MTQLISLIIFHSLKFTFTHFLAISQNFPGIWRVWLKFFADVSFFFFQFSSIWIALISEPLVPFGWTNPHWKAIMLLFSNIMRLTTFHVLFCWGQQFFIDFRKNMSGGINHVQGISASKIRWKMFFRKNLIIKKIYLHQQKMSGNNANFFDILKELLNSFFTPSLNH